MWLKTGKFIPLWAIFQVQRAVDKNQGSILLVWYMVPGTIDILSRTIMISSVEDTWENRKKFGMTFEDRPMSAIS